MLAPAVVAEPPPAWVEAAIARPPLGDAADLAFTQFRAHRAPDGSEAIVVGCVAAPIPGWVEDMRPSMEARGVALAGAAAERAAGTPVDARPEPGRFVLRVAGGDATPIGAARTSLGFSDDGKVVTCFAVCVSTARRPAATCEGWIAGSVRFAEGARPPAPGLALGAVTWAVHHPARTATGAGVAVALLGVLAVATRRKPRARI